MKNETTRQRRERRKPAFPYALGSFVAALFLVFNLRSHHDHLTSANQAIIATGLVLALGLGGRALWIIWKLEPRDQA